MSASVARIEEVRRARAWLSRAVEPGSLELHELLAAVGPVAAVAAIRSGTAPPEVAKLAEARRGDDRAATDLAEARRLGIRLVTPEDEEWPDRPLHAMHVAAARGVPGSAPPQALWVRGEAQLDQACERAVAIVGARSASAYGKWVATQLAGGLALSGWSVVSGGAFGIDTAAHRGSLAGGAPTVLVAACGLRRPYPNGNSSLFARVISQGVLVSEWPPDCPPQRHRFLVRNRLIAGLAAGTVVVEAAARSGARVTARWAGQLGTAVMAVPGPVTAAQSEGTHHLIREGEATLVSSAAHVLELVGGIGTDLAPLPQVYATARDSLSPMARRVLDGLPPFDAVSPDQLAIAAGVPVLDVLRSLPTLEIRGFVETAAGGWRLTHVGRA